MLSTDVPRRRLRIDLDPARVRYELLPGEPLELFHHGELVMLAADSRKSGRGRAHT
jgi:hypothetical protein